MYECWITNQCFRACETSKGTSEESRVELRGLTGSAAGDSIVNSLSLKADTNIRKYIIMHTYIH